MLTALLVVAFWAWGPAAAQDGDDEDDTGTDTASNTVIVATKALEPFVFVDPDADPSDGSGLRGYSIDVWNEVADRLDLQTEWVVEETVGDILDSARDGDADVAIAGISMTSERETFVDFSHPYYDSGLHVAVRPGSGRSTLSAIWSIITSGTVLVLAGGLILLTTAVAHLVWWTERRHNDEFPHSYRQGIGEALWWSSVSVVTGGEAVKNIRRPVSRVLALLWMLIGLFLFAFVTARAASLLTLNELQTGIAGKEDLGGERVVTVGGTVAETFLRSENLDPILVENIDEALAGVDDGRFDAVVYDSPVLAYRLNRDYAGRLEMVGDQFALDPYGIALQSGSELRERINAELLAMGRDGTLDRLHQEWLGVDR